MKKSGLLTIIFMVTILGLSFGQTIEFKGILKDKLNGDPVPYAKIVEIGELNGAHSDENGEFRIFLEKGSHKLEVISLGYSNKIIEVVASNDVDIHEYLLIPDIEYEPVIISAGPEAVLKDRTIHLYDYEFAGDELFMIIYDRQKKRPFVALVDARDSIIDLAAGPEKPGALVKDCLGNVHAITPHFACQLYINDGEIGMYRDSLELFKEYVEPCLANIGDHYYYEYFRFNKQILEYYAYNAIDQKGEMFIEIKDKEKIHRLMDPMSIYASLATSEEQMMSYGSRAWEEIGKLNHEFQFQQMAFFNAVDAPLRKINDEVVIFDHLNHRIRTYTPAGEAIGEVGVNYDDEKGWNSDIYVDEVRGEAFTAVNRHGYVTLKGIDLETGAINGSWEIPMQFPKKIRIRDGVLYFMYKELNYDDTKRLYRMRIRD